MSIDGLKKHTGQLTNTGVRVAVVFRKIPNDEEHCLIVETERLPDSYHDYLMECLNSKDALETNDFYEVLNRRSFSDGSVCLTALHQRGYLRKEPITNVTMLPLPGHAVPLSLINSAIDKTLDTADATGAAANTVEEPALIDPVAVAKGLLVQADTFEADAKRLMEDAKARREEAYALAPELKPTAGRPAAPEEVRQARLAERKAARNERDRANAPILKERKAREALEAKVAAKIERDRQRLKAEIKAKATAPAPTPPAAQPGLTEG